MQALNKEKAEAILRLDEEKSALDKKVANLRIQFEMEKSEKEKLKTHSLRTKEELQNYEREMEAMVTKKVRATRSIFHNVVAHVQGY
jgi:chromosome segregation ATPase